MRPRERIRAGAGQEGQMHREILKEFEQIENLDDAKFGKTVAVFGANTDNEHSAVYYGTDNDDIVYYYSKNGDLNGSSIETEQTLINRYEGKKPVYFNYIGGNN